VTQLTKKIIRDNTPLNLKRSAASKKAWRVRKQALRDVFKARLQSMEYEEQLELQQIREEGKRK
jgi:hypothetical protein